MFQARAQALASLRSQAPVFSGISNQDSFSAMSASRTIQAASIFYLDNLLATASALYTSSCLLFWLNSSTSTFSPITIFWICRIQAVWEALHSLLYISFPEFAGISTNSTIPYLVSLCLVSVASFSCLQVQPVFYFTDIFSMHILLIFYISLQDKDKGKSSTSSSTFRSLLLLECTLLVILC